MAFWGLMSLLTAASTGRAEEAVRPLLTVDRVDLNRYVGLWHEIARIPNPFQKQCASGTTAEYVLQEDGRVSVTNSCVKADGQLDQVRGVARVVDTATNARLKVSFVRLLGWQLFWGDYWIIGLDENYRWAIVGSPNRKYGWILGRDTRLSEADLEQIKSILTSQGYHYDDFIFDRMGE